MSTTGSQAVGRAKRRSPGEGGCYAYQTAAGNRWRIKCTVRLADGSRREVNKRGFPTKKAWLAALRSLLAAHTPAPHENPAAGHVMHLDPAGYYVYLLWAAQGDEAPLYVGSSGNILARLGAHLGDTGKRSQIGWVTVARFTSEKAMLQREGQLIRRHRPPWNKFIPPAEGAAPGPKKRPEKAEPGGFACRPAPHDHRHDGGLCGQHGTAPH